MANVLFVLSVVTGQTLNTKQIFIEHSKQIYFDEASQLTTWRVLMLFVAYVLIVVYKKTL